MANTKIREYRKGTTKEVFVVEPSELPEEHAKAFAEWRKKNAPNAEYFGMFEAVTRNDHTDFCTILNATGVPFRTVTHLGNAIVICFYTQDQNKHMMAGVRLKGIKLGLLQWGPL